MVHLRNLYCIQRHGSQLDTKAVVAFSQPFCVVLRFHDPTLPHLAGRLSSGSNARVLTEHTTCHNLPSCINLAPSSLQLVQPLWRVDKQLIQIMSRRVLSCLLSVSHRNAPCLSENCIARRQMSPSVTIRSRDDCENIRLIALLPDDFVARSPDELSLAKGDRLELIERDDDFGDGWFLGRHMSNGNTGLFPEGMLV